MVEQRETRPSPDHSGLSFEEALAKLEEIVGQLEEGQLGLSDALARYEEGVKHLKHCHEALERAERKILLLTGVDAQGNPVTEPFDDQSLTLEEKQDSRRRRRSSSARGSNAQPKSADTGDADVDTQRGLF